MSADDTVKGDDLADGPLTIATEDARMIVLGPICHICKEAFKNPPAESHEWCESCRHCEECDSTFLMAHTDTMTGQSELRCLSCLYLRKHPPDPR